VSHATPTLTTPRLLLRPWRDDDLEPMARILGDPEVMRYLFDPGPDVMQAARDAIARRLAHWREDGMGFWAVELRDAGELIGWTGLQRIRFERGVIGEVEVGWMLGKAWWGNGYAPEAARVSLEWGFEQHGLERIYAFCHPDNANSERVMVKLGMTAHGTTTDTRDDSVSMLYAIDREQWLARQEAS
jgi:RimJ/RimL family protein N-acetyltransferase